MSARLWTCPECGHRFVRRNMWHSCSSHALEHHFQGKEPHVRRTFDRFLESIEANGPVELDEPFHRLVAEAYRVGLREHLRR